MNKSDFKFQHLQWVKDTASGFMGTVMGTCFYPSGLNSYLVTAKGGGSIKIEEVWIDENRLELFDPSKELGSE